MKITGKEPCFAHHTDYPSNAVLEDFAALADCDVVVLLGGWCDVNGMPDAIRARRCEAAVSLRSLLPNCHRTIVTGRDRGLALYFKSENPDRTLTEASQFTMFCETLGADTSDYLLEPLAICTIGNIVFATRLMLEYGLKRPVFVSEAAHIGGLIPVFDNWFRRNGPIKPEFWPLRDPDPRSANALNVQQMLEYLRDRNRGHGHRLRFAREVRGLISGRRRSTQAAIKAAIKWLLKNDKRYQETYPNGTGLDLSKAT